jgi:PAS domain S-box-containing protein
MLSSGNESAPYGNLSKVVRASGERSFVEAQMAIDVDQQCRSDGFSDSAIPTMVVDREGSIHAVNPAAQKFFLYTLDELVGLNLATVVPTVEPGCFWYSYDSLGTAFEQRTGDRRYLLRAVQRNGGIIPVMFVTEPWAGTLSLCRFVARADNEPGPLRVRPEICDIRTLLSIRSHQIQPTTGF